MKLEHAGAEELQSAERNFVGIGARTGWAQQLAHNAATSSWLEDPELAALPRW